MTALETQGGPSIEHLCALGGVSRAGFYRFGEIRAPRRAEADLRDKIQAIALENRFYGYRRVKQELWRLHGLKINRKHVLRLMREDNLLCLRQKSFVPPTTDSRHKFPIVPNLTRDLVPTGLDQIWVADITYVRLAGQFVYLAVVLDAYSRKVVGWALADHLEASLAIEALDMALAARKPRPGLIHHSDRGVQYACGDYVEKLERHKIAVSMSRPGNPYDNAKAESFMKTLKKEEVNGKAYTDIEHARSQIGAFIDTVYNAKRLHSALSYKPPAEFEADLGRTNPLQQPPEDKALSPN
jgi:putative transposase